MRPGRTLASAALALGLACNAILGNHDATPAQAQADADGGGDETGVSADGAPLPRDARAGDAAALPDAPVTLADGGDLFASGTGDPRAVALDSTNVYWIDANHVYACP